MYVCLCSGLTEQNVRDAAVAGASQPSDVYRIFGRQMQCGTCVEAITEIINDVAGRLVAAALQSPDARPAPC